MGDSDFHRLRTQLLAEGKLYDDPHFQAIPRSVHFSKFDRTIIWRRPTEICSDPEFVVDGASRFDLDQGSLGDCWYIAAAATLTTRKKLLDEVVPRDQGFGDDYAGIFHFHFWRFGKWEEIIIDDKLPTNRFTGKLVFCNNRVQQNEFWSALLEKAYAKIHGSYEALDGGCTQDALVDFTGGIGHTIDLTKYRDKIPENIFDIFCDFHAKGSMLGSSILATKETMEHRKDNGLVIGHAYSITRLLRVQQDGRSIELVRLRNPWGEKEWNGPWSDGSKEWSSIDQATRQEIGLINDNDGEFWMSFADWIRNFDQMQACHVSPDAEIEGHSKWNEQDFHSCWVRGLTAGGCGNPPLQRHYWDNPQFSVTVKSADTKNPKAKSWVVISLMQKPPGRSLQGNPRTDRCAISFDLYKVKDGVPKLLEDGSYQQNTLQLTEKGSDYEYYREVAHTFQEEPGTYVIIPSTFEFGMERQFVLRVFSETEILGSELDTQTGSTEPSEVKDKYVISSLFGKHCGPDHAIDAQELQSLLNEAFASELFLRNSFELEACRSLLRMTDWDKRGRLEFDEIQRLWSNLSKWKEAFKQFDQDHSGQISGSDLRDILKSEGYSVSRNVLGCVVLRYADREGRLCFNDFIIAMSKVISVMDMFSKAATNGKAVFDIEDFMKMTLSF